MKNNFKINNLTAYENLSAAIDIDFSFGEIKAAYLDSSYYQIKGISATGDLLKIELEKDTAGNIFVSNCEGILKKEKLNVMPFYINNKKDQIMKMMIV